MSLNLSQENLAKRHRADQRFEWYGRLASGVALVFLCLVLGGILTWAYQGFKRMECLCDVFFDPKVLSLESMGPSGVPYFETTDLVKGGFEEAPLAARAIPQILAPSAHKILFEALRKDPSLLGKRAPFWLPLEEEAARALKKPSLAPEIAIMLKYLHKNKRIRSAFRWDFFSNGDSRDPVFAGIWSGIVGTFFLFWVTLVISFPIGVAAAFYLEELARPTFVSRFIEVNIANLSAVPSVVYGILGLSLFLNVMHLPRSSTLVGGLTLSLMTLPTVILVTRSAIRTVPKSIREAARGLGASSMQIICHHLFPLALPGIVTGTMIAMARALGETAPLLMIGMMAFVVEPAASLHDPSSALPVQIYAWARNPETTFLANASAALVVLMGFVAVMNLCAIYLRGKYEQKW
jgi:phosphate transport system permease protein